MKRLLSGGVFLAAVFASALHAAQPIAYMLNPVGTPPNPFTTTLPGYSGNVIVTQTPANVLPFISVLETTAQNGSTSLYTWGTDTNILNIYNNVTTTAGYENYTLTFTFTGAAPDPTKLVLMVAGLAFGTTATVSQSGTSGGEWQLSSNPKSSTTKLTGGTVLSSNNDGDPSNTGWFLFQFQTGQSFTTLTLTMHQVSGDGIGITLGYVQDNGYIEVCKASDATNPIPANGNYNFTVTGSAFATSQNPLVVPVGECSGPIVVTPPQATITELPTSGIAVTGITAIGYSAPPTSTQVNMLESSDLQGGSATVMVTMPATTGDTSTETLVTFTNAQDLSAMLKICKIAGTGVSVNTPFVFTWTPATVTIPPVEAGPVAEGGYCVVAGGTFPVGSSVVITETVPAGLAAPLITVNGKNTPSAGCTPAPNCVVARIGPGINEVSFTNSCLPGAACPTHPGAEDFSVLSIASYSLISQSPASAGQSFMTYQARLSNGGSTTMGPLVARLRSLDPSTAQVVGQGTLDFPMAPANDLVTSSNTFTILADPSVPVDFSKLTWTILSKRSLPPKH